MSTILVVDDEEKILKLLKSYLEFSQFSVFCARTGKEALQIFGREKIDLILLDLMLPGASGETVCETIREPAPLGFGSSVPIIMLTAKVDEESIVKGLNIGADDYVTKPFSMRTVSARVKAILRRTSSMSGENKNGDESKRINCGDLVICSDTKIVTKNGSEINLTPAEFKILHLLAGRREKIWSRDEIVEHALGDDFDGFDRAVDSHIKNLRQKIGDDPKNPTHIITVYGSGYRCK
ncbi:MAG: response regulator transcription factor [Termitinemataceae bacterium]|nr:MAG: response regulator transcription factor [Termitinemataceae bacterium]